MIPLNCHSSEMPVKNNFSPIITWGIVNTDGGVRRRKKVQEAIRITVFLALFMVFIKGVMCNGFATNNHMRTGIKNVAKDCNNKLTVADHHGEWDIPTNTGSTSGYKT